MSTAETVTAPMLAKPKVPAINPWLAPNLACPNKDCGKIITPVIEASPKGGEKQLIYRCWDCRWEVSASLIPINGQCYAIGQDKRPPEWWERSKSGK